MCVLLGIIGAFLPILPTTPFLLLAAFCYSKSNNKFHSWLSKNKYLGPPITDWEKNGTIKIKSKILATIMLSLVAVWRLPKLPISFELKLLFIIILSTILIFIWSRPSQTK